MYQKGDFENALGAYRYFGEKVATLEIAEEEGLQEMDKFFWEHMW